ncbi:hypothetical protein ABPG72_008393 [Tetrahymena utriculariae]
MKTEIIKIKYILITNSSKKQKDNKQCSYKYIIQKRCGFRQTEAQSTIQDSKLYYNQYVKLFQDKLLNLRNKDEIQLKIEKEPKIEFSQSDEQSFLQSEEMQNQDNPYLKNVKQDKYKEHYKNNMYKNIMSAFQRHIESLNDLEIIKCYESLTEDKWPFSYIKIRVNQNLKKLGRFHLKLRNLLTSKNLKNLFIYFLKNSNSFWIQKSRVKDKEMLFELIEQLISQSQNEQFIESIKFYQKPKRLY